MVKLGTVVLIIDDHHDTCLAIERLIKACGLAAKCVTDPQIGIAFLRSNPLPTLVVLDDMMPDMSGIEVLEQLKADPRLCHIPVVMHSASAEDDRVERAAELGAIG